MEKNLSKTLFHPSCQISNFIETDQSTVELERKYMLPPITTQVSVPITPHGDFTTRTFMTLKTATQPQLPMPWLQFDLHSMIPNKSRKIVKRTLKEKHISKSKLAHMFEQIVEWIRTMSMDVVLPALVLCLREEESMILEAKTRAEEWEKLNIDVPYNYNCAHCNRTGNGHISSVEASIIGKKIFARVMHFLHCKYLLNKSDGRFLEIPDRSSDSITSLNGCLKQELIHTFSKDLISCVYQELLNNDMGKTFPVDYLCLELLRQMFTEIPARWEFYMDVLEYFSQRAAENHLKLFLRLPLTPHEDCMNDFSTLEENWHSADPRTMTKTERTTLNILRKTVTDTIMDIVDQATENPLRAAEIVRQGNKSGAQSADEELHESELFESKTPKPDIMPENEVLGPSSETKLEAQDSEQKVALENVISNCCEELYELKSLRSKTPRPDIMHENEVFRPSSGIKLEALDSEQEVEIEDVHDEAPFERSSQRGTEEEASQGLTLPYHLLQSVVDGLLAKLEATYHVDIFGIYFSEALVASLAKGLAHLEGINVTSCSLSNKCFPDENNTVLQIVNEAHGILTQKNYLKAVWDETEMAVIYLTAILSAVILDYMVMCPKAQKNDVTSESFTLWGSNTGSWNPPVNNEFCIEKELIQACAASPSPVEDIDSSLCNTAQASIRSGKYQDSVLGEIHELCCEDQRLDSDKSLSPALRYVTPKVKKKGIQVSLSKLFFFKNKASQRVGPCP